MRAPPGRPRPARLPPRRPHLTRPPQDSRYQENPTPVPKPRGRGAECPHAPGPSQLRRRPRRPRRHRPAHRGSLAVTSSTEVSIRDSGPATWSCRSRTTPIWRWWRSSTTPPPTRLRFGQAGAGPLRPRRWLARLGRVGQRHRDRREALGREAAAGNRHRPDGTELLWKQIGVNGLISDPQLPFFIEWLEPRRAAPVGRWKPRLVARVPRDRRRPAAGQRVAGRDRRGAAGGRQGRVGSAERDAGHHRRPVPDPERAGPGLTPPRPSRDHALLTEHAKSADQGGRSRSVGSARGTRD